MKRETASTRIAGDPEREKRFRCGYREGYIDAINQMQHLIEDNLLAIDSAAAVLTAHWAGPLEEWFKADRNLRLDPPVPERT